MHGEKEHSSTGDANESRGTQLRRAVATFYLSLVVAKSILRDLKTPAAFVSLGNKDSSRVNDRAVLLDLVPAWHNALIKIHYSTPLFGVLGRATRLCGIARGPVHFTKNALVYSIFW